MNQPPPERLPDVMLGQQPVQVPAHHRPPNIAYDEYGRPHHVILGQPTPAPVIVQMPQQPQQQGMDPALFRLIVITFLVLAVVVVCTGALCAIVVLMGGTLIGIIGAVGQNLTSIVMCLIGAIVAAGWAASKLGIQPGAKGGKKK